MVGAGSLIQPLLGYPHWVGVVLVGIVVITIVVTAGMVSTTWVQFFKGSLLVVFSAILVMMVLNKGLTVDNETFEVLGPRFHAVGRRENRWPYGAGGGRWMGGDPSLGNGDAVSFIRLESSSGVGFDIYHVEAVSESGGKFLLRQAQAITVADGKVSIDGAPRGTGETEKQLLPVGRLSKLPDDQSTTGPLGPVSYFTTLSESEVMLWGNQALKHSSGATTTVYCRNQHKVIESCDPVSTRSFEGSVAAMKDRMNFLSLMLALFCGILAASYSDSLLHR